MQLEIGKRIVQIHGGQGPLVLLHENHGEGAEIWNRLMEKGCACTLAAVSGIAWERDLSPWQAPAVFKQAEPFAGGADVYLRELQEEILPRIRESLPEAPQEQYIAGYSLAGLFAMYSTLNSALFDGFVSASGSMWYPGWMDYAESHAVSARLKRAYFSIGDRESRTRNQQMRPVEDNTRALEQMLRAAGIQTCFELNAGGHFADDAERVTKGIAWMLSEER